MFMKRYECGNELRVRWNEGRMKWKQNGKMMKSDGFFTEDPESCRFHCPNLFEEIKADEHLFTPSSPRQLVCIGGRVCIGQSRMTNNEESRKDEECAAHDVALFEYQSTRDF